MDYFATSTCTRTSGGTTPYDCDTHTESSLDFTMNNYQCVPDSSSQITCYPTFNYVASTSTGTSTMSTTTVIVDFGDIIFMQAIGIFFLSIIFFGLIFNTFFRSNKSYD